MAELKDLLGEGLEVYIEKDGGFIPVLFKIPENWKPIIVISVVERLGQELAKKSLRVVKELDEHLHNSGKKGYYIDGAKKIVIPL